MDKKPILYTIILNYINYSDTINLVNNLRRQIEVEIVIIIVDNNSPNDSFQIIQAEFKNEDHIHILNSGKNGGYGFGNNVGLRYISRFDPQYVAILNNDIYIDDILMFKKLIEELDQHSKAYFCAPSMMVNGIRINNAWKVPSIYFNIISSLKYSQKLLYPLSQYKYDKETKTEIVECVPGSFFVSVYEKFQKIGFFDENIFLFGEETILGFKIKKNRGYNILCRHLTYEHSLSKSINKFYNKLSIERLGQKSQEYYHKYYTKDFILLRGILKIVHEMRIIEEVIFNIIYKLKPRLVYKKKHNQLKD